MKKIRNEDAFLELLRCGMWGTVPDLKYFEGLTEFDWLEIYMIAGKQTVLGLCLKPILDLPNNVKPPTKLLLQWVGLNRYIEATNYKMLQTWNELKTRFETEGITPVLLKGLSVARWYAHPMSRQSSDIDLFIPEKFDKAIELVKSWGLECKHKEQHDTIVYKGVCIEIHPNVITAPFKPHLNTTLQEFKIIGDTQIRTTDPDTTSLLLLSHAGGHFMNPGIGYRFLCDWAVFLKNNYQQINVDFVLQESRRMGMERFVVEFTKLAQDELGLDFPGLENWTKGANPKYTSKLSFELFEQGDFGAINFQKGVKGNKLETGWHLISSLLANRYYWPRLFWRRFPRLLYKLLFKRFFPSKESK